MARAAGDEELEQLRRDIATLRKRLEAGLRPGEPLNDPMRLSLSQRVDRLVVEYMRKSRRHGKT